MRGSTSSTSLNGHGHGHGQGQGEEQTSGLQRTVSKKRKRGEDPLDPALTATGPAGVGVGMGLGGGGGQQQPHQQPHQQQQHHEQHQQQFDGGGGGGGGGGSGLDIRTLPPQQSLAEARAAGVHSAAALFRQPSSNKKYTRPPMSKLFASLELSPENFLHLQAAAKAYMLDEKHPERRECVGQRGKGDTEMVKLRLWNCVRHFLEVEGYGERFFGEHVVNEGMGPRQHVWPRDQHKIISLVIPLLRRMVTNERQRQYAIETRKGGGAEERRRRKMMEESLRNANAQSQQAQPDQQRQQQQQQQLQMQSQGHPHDHSLAAPPPPMPPQTSSTELGLTDLLLEGYPTDWNTVSKTYDMYNQDYQLDNLWAISGLQQPDWRGLVAAVDSHYQVLHNGNVYDCAGPCEDLNISRIVSSDAMAHVGWRVGGNQNVPARNEFASSITRDVSRIIRDSLASRRDNSHPPHQTSPQSAGSDPSHSRFFPPPPTAAATTTTTTTAPHHQTQPQPQPQTPITLRINIVHNGKRILPRLDVPADQCPDLETAKQLISRRFAGQLPPPAPGPETSSSSVPEFDSSTGTWNSSSASSTAGAGAGSGWRFKVWLPEGLVPVQNDGEWTIAQLSAGTVDWMDGDLRVVVEVGVVGGGGGGEKS